MINVGIVGSSFSEGAQNIIVDGQFLKDEDCNYITTKNLVHIFKDYNENKELDFFSLADSGHGSEKYLSDIIYLKNKHDIKILLIELVENRAERMTPTKFEEYFKILNQTIPVTNLERKDNISGIIEFGHSKGMSFPLPFESYNKGSEQNFENFLDKMKNSKDLYHYHDLNKLNVDKGKQGTKKIIFFTMHDIVQTLNLCKLLNIIPVIWHYISPPLIDYGFVKLYQNSLIKFKKYLSAYEYFYKKNNGVSENFTCDGHHLNDISNEELVSNFLLPKIQEAYDKSKN